VTTTTSAAASAVSVAMDGFAFSPSSLRAGAGPITFSVTNRDAATHTFTISGTDVDVRVSGGSTGGASSTLAAGSYDFHCEIHPSMTGTLTVS
jgi:plastocyanin